MKFFCIPFIFVILFTFLSISSVHGQMLDHVQGQILVQLDHDVEIDQWINHFNRKHSNDVELIERISPVLDMYVLGFDFTSIDEQQLLYEITIDRPVIAAQYNHFIKLRSTIPDDPQFQDQWQYINTGQNGGVNGADIDMDLAWDLTTGGLTAQGDTIVVCVIDDGINGMHEDIVDNLFLNHAEIPGNGIDDDNNGFIDDYRGWRTSDDSDNVYSGGGHGTPVAGIVGAKGNNGTGVAGVNWNVKLMIVRGGTGVESEVIEAYSYPYTFRKRYNETDGQEGAFVVSTNASWGIDFGQPDDSPLWCAFYDTLGAQGIISCGATINGNTNVDLAGDLPTACPSDYLISVTNMNSTDTKVTGAGYGIETIDMGAFGQGTWTTSFNGYNSFGGTSGATPHVTGAIGLLYSLPCSNLATIAKENPQSAAEIIRDAILNGTDPNSSLEGITVTGGRLNVKNSMDLILQSYCDDCLGPFIEEVNKTSDDSVEVTWEVNDTTESVNIRYKIAGDMEWILEENVSSPYIFDNLDLCETYEFQIQSICTNSEGEFLITNSFTTEGCCINPTNFERDAITVEESLISWDGVPAAESYNIRYKKLTETEWTELTSATNSITIPDLESCSQYEFQVQSDCLLPSPDFAETFEFFTIGCEEACSQLPYCGVDGYNSSEEWITLVVLDDEEHISISDNGYGNHLDAPVDFQLMQNGFHFLLISPDYESTLYNENFMVWIDFDQNGEFDEIDELVFLEVGKNTDVSGTIAIPEDALLGSTRMRIAMIFNSDPVSCTGEGFDEFGEVEDYCVNINPFTCPELEDIEVTDIENTSGVVQWNGNLNHDDYLIEYREVGTTEWIEVSAESNNEHVLIDLIECQTYEVRIATSCPIGNEMKFSEIIEFETGCTLSTKPSVSSGIEALYPNPFNDNLTIQFLDETSFENLNISILDFVGKKVNQFNTGQISNSYNFSTDHLIPGMYLIQIRDDYNEIIHSQKLVKI